MMLKEMKKSALLCVSFWLISCFAPVMSWSVVAVQTEVVSGNIAQKYDDHSVKLDNGKIYYPSRNGLVVDVPVGESVTLRIVEETDKKVFFEYAPGLNSLKEIPPAPIRKDSSPK